MINKNTLFILALLGSCFYFYNKGDTDMLIIISLLAIYTLINDKNEHAGNVTATNISTTEAIQNLSSMYNNSTLTTTNLKVTGKIEIGDGLVLSSDKGDASIETRGNMNIIGGKHIDVSTTKPEFSVRVNSSKGGSGNLYLDGSIDSKGKITAGDIAASNGFSTNGSIAAKGNMTVDGNIYVQNLGKSLIVGGNAISSNNDNMIFYRTNDGRALFLSNNKDLRLLNPHRGVHDLGDWNAYQNGVARV